MMARSRAIVHVLLLVALANFSHATPADKAAATTTSVKDAEVDGGSELTAETFDWDGTEEVTSFISKTNDDEPDDEALGPQQRRLINDLVKEEADHGRRTRAETRGNILDAVWNRGAWRRKRFNLTSTPGEHSCFDGFQSMLRDTDRCHGWQRHYPSKGSKMTFQNTGMGVRTEFTLADVVGKHINVWLEDGSTSSHKKVAVKAAEIYANVLGVEELKPVPESSSWMDHQCKVFGSMPFMYTCSDRINILVQKCHIVNAWVSPRDFLENYPQPANNQSRSNFDIVFYMCQELLDQNPNPYSAATTFAHELAHVIQGGFGSTFMPMTEGGATWLEGSLLNLPPRPMTFGWGFKDWNYIMGAHLYATTKLLNARKFYQIHAYFLSYLSQKELLGDDATSALQNYQTFDRDRTPWGRGAYDYFMTNLGKGEPSNFKPVMMDVNDTLHPFGTALLDYRVAIAAQCISDAALRPTEARYSMPAHLRERPFWDCSTFPTWNSAGKSSVEDASAKMFYGGAAIFRLANPENAVISVSKEADPDVRTKVLAAGDTAGNLAEVKELRPGESTSFSGKARELFVVQVNVDPQGETIALDDQKGTWTRSAHGCVKGCSGRAWTTAKAGQFYRSDSLSSLRSPLVELPKSKDIRLQFMAKWDMEGPANRAETFSGCGVKGYDGVQVRLHVYKDATSAAAKDRHEDGDKVYVLRPEGGYGARPEGSASEEALTAFITKQLLRPLGKSVTCSDAVGFTGKSPSADFLLKTFSLDDEAGKAVRVEVIFASDSSFDGQGFWMDDLRIVAGQDVLLKDDAEIVDESKSMFEHLFTSASPAGNVGSSDGVPVVVKYPAGYRSDPQLEKHHISKSAPWSAHWSSKPSDPVAEQRRSYLGWSYMSKTYKVATARLHPWQEACVQLEAPFNGYLDTATLTTLVDKVGVSSVKLTARSVDKFEELGGGSVNSSSNGVSDPGVHRFKLGSKMSPHLAQGQAFLLCVGTGDVKSLPYDGDGLKPFLHLPLSQANKFAKAKGKPGWTFLRAGDKVKTNPWKGHTLSLRAEFVESEPARRLEVIV